SVVGAQLIVGDVFDPVAVLGENWRRDSLLIFPDEHALSAEQGREETYRSLVLLDGSWRKVARLMHLNPWLKTLPCLAIDAENDSQYRIRKSPRADGLSTIEAAVTALNTLQLTVNYNDILPAFHKMIALQIAAMGEDTYNKNYSGR
ncbi:MAG: DTW domain-containing protein, partial [Spongiibacteraceae bacterium]